MDTQFDFDFVKYVADYFVYVYSLLTNTPKQYSEDYEIVEPSDLEDKTKVIKTYLPKKYTLLDSIYTRHTTPEDLQNYGFTNYLDNPDLATHHGNCLIVGSRDNCFQILQKLIDFWQITNLNIDLVSHRPDDSQYQTHNRFKKNVMQTTNLKNFHHIYLTYAKKEEYTTFIRNKRDRDMIPHLYQKNLINLTILDNMDFELGAEEINIIKQHYHQNYFIIIREDVLSIPTYIDYHIISGKDINLLAKHCKQTYPRIMDDKIYIIISNLYVHGKTYQINYLKL